MQSQTLIRHFPVICEMETIVMGTECEDRCFTQAPVPQKSKINHHKMQQTTSSFFAALKNQIKFEISSLIFPESQEGYHRNCRLLQSDKRFNG